MNRWLWMASMAILLTSTTGCLRHHTRSGCQSGACNSCNSCGVGGGGLLGKLGHNCRTGCTPGPIGWQQGGLNYSGHLCPHGGTAGHPGPYHGAHGPGILPGHNAAYQLQNQPYTAGPATGAVAYPYYTHRGPRDFLLDNPPTIGR
jgi:hypothetical protein